MIAVNIPESVALLPVLVAVSIALILAKEDREANIAKDLHNVLGCCGNGGAAQGGTRCLKVSVLETCTMESSEDECYLFFKEWTSSTGFIFFCFVTYILLVAITNSIACYKFITTWNRIAESLRNHNDNNRSPANRRDAAAAAAATQRRRMCQDALAVSRYHQDGSAADTAADCASSCPVCLIEFRDQELVTSCDKGCCAVFHKDCLFQWLEYKLTHHSATDENDDTHQGGSQPASCPCCRKELIGVVATAAAAAAATRPSRPSSAAGSDWLSDLSTFMGYYPR
jgi:hypothetical protein